ncbi:MAG: hypothetical protein WAK20_01640 [Candidatus Acidiferrum sp.]
MAISYDLIRDWEGIFEDPRQFRAVLEPRFFEFTTANALVHPKLNPLDMVNAHFDWQRLPSVWTVETSFGIENRCQAFTGFWYHVEDALFAAGDFRLHQLKVHNRPVVVAIRGKWSFTDDEATSQIQKIIGVEREFWRNYDFPYFLVTVAPFEKQNGSSDGSAFTNAFWLFLGQSQFSYGVQYLLAHESFHAWNPHKMGAVREPEADEKWFTEGFTVYYSDVLLLRSGLLLLPDYIENINRRIRDYETSAVMNLSNKEIVARYDEYTVNQLPYVRGPILALWLDSEIRRQSKSKSSLDSVMRGLVHDESKHPEMELSSERVFRAVSKYLNHDASESFQKLVLDGGPIPIPEFPVNSCVHLSEEQVSVFDLGFDADVLRATNLVSNVRQDSEAYKAGVRDGQEVVGMSIHWNDVSKPARLTIHSSEGQKKIEYFPRGQMVSVPQYHLDQAAWASTPERCKEGTPRGR